jgi:hypothetical protein
VCSLVCRIGALGRTVLSSAPSLSPIYLVMRMRKKPLDIWWFRGADGTENFGDALGPVILERLGIPTRRVPVAYAELVACGSVMHQLSNPATVVWGTGMMHPNPLSVQPTDVRAVRGALTAGHLGLKVPLGDPGLLVSALWPRSPVKYRFGVVPHWRDERSWPDADAVIDVTRPVDEVISQISSCATIAGSSLHGLIVAQSFGIPTMRVAHPRTTGGGHLEHLNHKYLDYLTALDRPLSEIQETLVTALGMV